MIDYTCEEQEQEKYKVKCFLKPSSEHSWTELKLRNGNRGDEQ